MGLLVRQSFADPVDQERRADLAVLDRFQLDLALDRAVGRWLHIDLDDEVSLLCRELCPALVTDKR